MFVKSLIKILVSIILTGFLLFCPITVFQVEASNHTAWQRLVTKHTIICYQNLEDLKKFDNKIDFSPGEWGIKSLFSGSKLVKGKLARKIDALFEKVQEILDMHKRMKKVRINIYKSKKQLQDAYYRIYKKKCRIRSWYLFERKTIYSNVDDLFVGMLAHEMAHHISDHYLMIRPPRATAEILARYVDKHLFDKVKKY